MAVSTICTPCREQLRQQMRQLRRVRSVYCTSTSSTASPGALRYFSSIRPLSTQISGESAKGKTGNKDFPHPFQDHPTVTEVIAKNVRKAAPRMTETYVAFSACEQLVRECGQQADYKVPQAGEKGVQIPETKAGEHIGVGTGWWYDDLGLTPTFNTWTQITYLHMYLLNVRFRMLPVTIAPTWQQHLLDHFFYSAEDRMTLMHNIAAQSIRNRYLKDLFVQWRGLLAGYDEGLVKGDAVLATAIWRNVFKADENVDWRGVGEVVSYMRGVLKGLEGIPDEDICKGNVEFGNPETERKGILVRSRMMDAPGDLAGGTPEAEGQTKAMKSSL